MYELELQEISDPTKVVTLKEIAEGRAENHSYANLLKQWTIFASITLDRPGKQAHKNEGGNDGNGLPIAMPQAERSTSVGDTR